MIAANLSRSEDTTGTTGVGTRFRQNHAPAIAALAVLMLGVGCSTRAGGYDLGPTGGGDPFVVVGGRVDGPADSALDQCAAAELCDDGLDNNCDGEIDEGCACEPGTTQRCFDGDPTLAGRGVCAFGSQLCSGSVGDEFGTWGPCIGSGRPQDVKCGAGLDYRCNGIIDEGCPCPLGETRTCYTGPTGSAGVGECRAGTTTCVEGAEGPEWGSCEGQTLPRPDQCDGADLDCDGHPGTGCQCVLGSYRACYTGPEGSRGLGECRGGEQSCTIGDGGVAQWGPCEGQVLPEEDLCDGVDRACTGMPGAGCECAEGEVRPCYGGPLLTRGVGRCQGGEQRCEASSGPPGWSDTCSGEILPVAEICDNGEDDDCDGQVDEGCRGSISCPDGLTTPAGRPVAIAVRGTNIEGYRWRIAAGPEGGSRGSRFQPALPTGPSANFLPFLIGDYRIEVSGTDGLGERRSCEVPVTATPHGMRVELTWDGGGDVDLHVRNGAETRWFASDDCFYGNRSPAWGGTLDVDERTAHGPENVAVDSPEGGTYVLAVHNYADAEGRIARIRVFCGDETESLAFEQESRPLAGDRVGACVRNDLWEVATVVAHDDGNCTVTSIDTYRQTELCR